MSNFKIPVIDMSKATTDRIQLANTIVRGLEEIGFLYIENVKGIDYGKLYDTCRWFFNLPIESKMELTRKPWNSTNDNVFRGYFPVVDEEPNRNEGFEFGRDVSSDDTTVAASNWFYEKSVWPKKDGEFGFKPFMQDLYEILHETSQEILKLIAVGLGITENAFENLFSDKPTSTFRIIHYPPWDGTPSKKAMVEDGKVVTIQEHMDSEFITLLHTFNYSGLEVKQPPGKWMAVPPRRNSLIMNIGVAFSKMLNGRFKATSHRVLDIGVDRYSVPFFLAPSYESDISINFMSRLRTKDTNRIPERYDPWDLKRIKHEQKYFQFRYLPELEEN